MGKAILLTGNPGSGKTTLIRQAISHLPGGAGGFYTQELRTGGVRKGFELVTLDGRRGILAHVEFSGPQRIGKYGVDLAVLDRLAVGAIREAILQAVGRRGVVVIDEIGPMEILSREFRQAVLEALDSEVAVLGTIVKRSIPYTDQIKRRPDVRLVEVRPDNRDRLLELILEFLREG